MDTFDYDVAITFAGEDRVIAEAIALGLRAKGISVFYDMFERAELWGADLSEALPDRYVRARYCLMIVTQHYMTKVWTVLERQAVIWEFLKRRGKEYILPLYVAGDIISVPGLSGLTGYLKINSISEVQTVIDLILEKLQQKKIF